VANNAQALSGFDFLVVEDEPIQAHLIGELIDNMGGNVCKTAYTYEQARDAVSLEAFDCAILDVNLGGTLSFRIADLLRMRGTPFVFCTAYSTAVEVYPAAQKTPRLDKPVGEDELRDAVLQAMGVWR
jgi:CheY-like chemotaxis protein